jgi:hypothetical protein
VDDSSNAFASAVALSGITSIGAGESVIFIESNNLTGARAAFISTWFGGNAPAGLQIGAYTGSGIGLSTSDDAVNLYDGTGASHPRSVAGSSHCRGRSNCRTSQTGPREAEAGLDLAEPSLRIHSIRPPPQAGIEGDCGGLL